MLGKSDEIKVAIVSGAYLEKGINDRLTELGSVEVLDIKFDNDKAFIIYKK